MGTVLDNSLYENDGSRFQQIADLSRQFMVAYCGNNIIRESIFLVMANYARKHELPLELLRYPFQDDELWAFTFLKQGTVFVCINSELPMCKQIFAAAHELYHIFCYAEDVDPRIIREGSVLDSRTADEAAKTQEDREANAFAALLLMPDLILNEQITLCGISKSALTSDEVLTLMDFFAIPYKAVILRLYESQSISRSKAVELLEIPSEEVNRRIALTGKAKRWQLNGSGTESLGSLPENLEFNRVHDLLTDSRREEDAACLNALKQQLGIQ